MAIINMTKTCKANGITTFSRTRGGWMKMVEGIDRTKVGGYSFIGDQFYKVGNFKTNLPDGVYLDQSTLVVDGEKTVTMNLLNIEEGKVTLIKNTPKTKGWEIEFWNDAEEYLRKQAQTEVTAQDIINTIKEMTDSEDIIDEVITKLSSEKSESHYAFKNWYEVKSILTEMECFALPMRSINRAMEDIITEDTYILKCEYLTSRYPYTKYITTYASLFRDLTIDENTPIDYRSITPTTFRSKTFQNEIKTKDSHYLARTIPNATGYHNGIEVTMFYVENNIICIREFSYYIDTYKAGQVTDEILIPMDE